MMYTPHVRRFSTAGTHLRARIDHRAPTDTKTASFRNATAPSDSHPVDIGTLVPIDESSVIVREINQLPKHLGWDGSFMYPRESVLNFTPLGTIDRLHKSALDRAIREVPFESKQEILSKRLVRPVFASEPSQGTPRREYQGGMIDGVRVRAVFNPYYRPTGQKLKQMNRWKSRDWFQWNPLKVGVRGSTKMYNIPDDIVPKKDELGEWRDPKLSGRYQADVRRQYTVHGLPWIYKRDFLEHKMHILDKEPIGPKRWYKREYRMAKIREAMRNMNSLVEDYRSERKAAKKKTWFEQIVHKLVGGQLASKYIAERKLPKI